MEKLTPKQNNEVQRLAASKHEKQDAFFNHLSLTNRVSNVDVLCVCTHTGNNQRTVCCSQRLADAQQFQGCIPWSLGPEEFWSSYGSDIHKVKGVSTFRLHILLGHRRLWLVLKQQQQIQTVGGESSNLSLLLADWATTGDPNSALFDICYADFTGLEWNT